MQSVFRARLWIFSLTVLAAAMPIPISAGELEWRRGRSSVTTSSASANTQRLAQARIVEPRVDPAVRPAAFEDESGPQFTPSAKGQVQFRSVVVDRSETDGSVRSAQLPPAIPNDTDAQLEEELRSPFIDTPSELPPLEETPPTSLDTPTLPDDTTLQFDQNQRQPIQRAPAEFQPRVPPVRGEVTPPLPDDVPPLSTEAVEVEREKAQEACSQGFADLKAKTIGKLDLSIAVSGAEGSDFPFECSIDEGMWHSGRCWEQTTYLWKASALCHKPLYFEDEQLERYGHSFSPCFQPFISGAHFFTRLPILPYCMGVEPPCECIYSLGHYRPGSCAPYMCNPVPLSVRGGLIQAGAAVGAAAVLP